MSRPRVSHSMFAAQAFFLIVITVYSMIVTVMHAAGTNDATMIVHLADAKQYPIPGGTCHLYPDCPTGRLSCALVEQKGRYPEKGYKVNEKCTEAIFVIEGSFIVTLGDESHKVSKSDVVYIVPGTKYSLEGEGKAFVFIEPKWDGAQNTPAN